MKLNNTTTDTGTIQAHPVDERNQNAVMGLGEWGLIAIDGRLLKRLKLQSG